MVTGFVKNKLWLNFTTQNISGVNLLDKKLGTYMYPHKFQKWYHTLFHRMMQLALINGYVVYSASKRNLTRR